MNYMRGIVTPAASRFNRRWARASPAGVVRVVDRARECDARSRARGVAAGARDHEGCVTLRPSGEPTAPGVDASLRIHRVFEGPFVHLRASFDVLSLRLGVELAEGAASGSAVRAQSSAS